EGGGGRDKVVDADQLGPEGGIAHRIRQPDTDGVPAGQLRHTGGVPAVPVEGQRAALHRVVRLVVDQRQALERRAVRRVVLPAPGGGSGFRLPVTGAPREQRQGLAAGRGQGKG